MHTQSKYLKLDVLIELRFRQLTLYCLNFQQYEDIFQYLRTATLLNFDIIFWQAFPSFYCSYQMCSIQAFLAYQMEFILNMHKNNFLNFFMAQYNNLQCHSPPYKQKQRPQILRSSSRVPVFLFLPLYEALCFLIIVLKQCQNQNGCQKHCQQLQFSYKHNLCKITYLCLACVRNTSKTGSSPQCTKQSRSNVIKKFTGKEASYLCMNTTSIQFHLPIYFPSEITAKCILTTIESDFAFSVCWLLLVHITIACWVKDQGQDIIGLYESNLVKEVMNKRGIY